MLISHNLPVRKSYFDSNIISNKNARILRRFFLDYFEADINRSTCLHVTSSRHEISIQIMHKFSHGAISYTLNGENINIMLELQIQHSIFVFTETLHKSIAETMKFRENQILGFVTQ